ncbi:MAG: hypothetical protein AB1861_06175 [Cyanobacteriota bacterium]
MPNRDVVVMLLTPSLAPNMELLTSAIALEVLGQWRWLFYQESKLCRESIIFLLRMQLLTAESARSGYRHLY